jgi:starvation-inducible DNA-binding protein
MFMTQYTEQWTALDEIAERIRALDHFAPGSGAQFAALSSVREESGVPDWRGMVEQLVEGHDTCARTARKVFKGAESAGDQPTCDLLTVRLNAHEKTAWMLRALLE